MGLIVLLLGLACLVLLVPIALFLGTFIFRLSCQLCGLPKPGLLAATGKSFVTWLAFALAIAILRVFVHTAGDLAGVQRWESGLATWLLALPVDLVITSSIHAGLARVPYGKAVEVWFVQRLIQLSIVVVILFIAALIYLVQTMNG